jgi:hypothetical protein
MISTLSPIGSKSCRIATNLERDELGQLRVRYELGSRAARIGDVGLRRERCCWASAVLRAERAGRLWLGQAGQLGRVGVAGKRMAVGPGSTSDRVSAHSQFCYLKFLFLFQICL